MENLTPEQILSKDVMPVAVVSATRFNTPYNQKGKPKKYYITKPEHLTVPDQSLSVAELLYRFSHGQPLLGRSDAYYDTEQDVIVPPNWEKLDISEKMAFMEEKRAEYQELEKKARDRKNQLENERLETEVSKRVAAKLATNRQAIHGVRETPKIDPNAETA